MAAPIFEGIIYSPYPDVDAGIQSFPELIEESLVKYGDKVIAIDRTERLTAGELLARINKYAVGFQQCGLTPGCRVCVLIHDSVENMAAALAVVFLGGTIVMTPTVYLPGELLYMIKDSRCNYLFADHKSAPKALEVNKDFYLKGLFTVGEVPGFTNISKFLEISETKFRKYIPSDSRRAVAVVLYTSGSTGLRKGTEISHKAMISAFRSFEATGYCNEEDVYLSTRSFSYVSGMRLITAAMCLGATVIIRERNLSLEEFVDVVRTYAVTLMSWTPLMMQGIIRQATASGTSIPSVKTIIITGDILSKTLAKEINIHFRPRTLANSYALTESFGMISTTPVGEVALGNTGYPVAGCKVKVVHLDSGESLKAYERGEILAQGNNMMNGYYGKPEATNTAFTTDGWLRTGDLGYYDDTGRIYVVERLKQMIKVLDHHVTPAEIEELLLTHAAVAEVAVVGIPNQEHGETPVACVVLNESHRRNSQTVDTELMQLLTDNTTVHKHRFTSIAFWDSLPKTDTGKILRRELKIILSNLQSKEK